MEKIIEIIEQLRATSSTKEKENILKNNKDNGDLRRTLFYTYNPYMKYGISEKSIKPDSSKPLAYFDVFELLDVLERNNINDNLRFEVNNFLGNFLNNEKLFDLYKCMILKDLRCNISAKTINKVFKGLIPTFDVMLASKFFDNESKVKGDFIITTKLDGGRAVIIKENDNIKVFTRQGQLIENLVEIEEEAKLLPNNFVYDGELLLRNDKNLASKDLYRATMKETRKDGIKKNLIFNCFDIVPLDDFKSGICKTKCIDRKNQLHKLLSKLNLEHVIEVPMLYVGSDKNKIIELLDEAKSREEEGVMLNTLNGVYETKRTKELLKVKVFQSCDLRIIGFQEGEGKYKNSLGALLVDYKGFELGVGSGFDDKTRSLIWTNRDSLLGSIVEVQYFEETTNQNGGTSVRFPVYKGLRNDKSEPSYN